MRHKLGNRKLSRATDQRLAMLRSIVASLIKCGKVKITYHRAKEASKMADKVVALAKYNDMTSKRRVLSIIQNKEAVDKLFKEASARFEGRSGGFTRITKIGKRLGDNAPVALLEFV